MALRNTKNTHLHRVPSVISRSDKGKLVVEDRLSVDVSPCFQSSLSGKSPRKNGLHVSMLTVAQMT